MSALSEHQAQTRAMAAMYDEGATLREVGRAFGLTEDGVSKRFRRAGVPRRRGGRREITPQSVEAVRRLYVDEKLTLAEVSEELGISVGAVRQRLKLAGVVSRDRRRRTCWRCGQSKLRTAYRSIGCGHSRVCRRCEEVIG